MKPLTTANEVNHLSTIYMNKFYIFKKTLIFFACTFLSAFAFAQPTVMSINQDVSGTYTNTVTTLKGGVFQARFQENGSGTAAGVRNWQFNADAYFNTWGVLSTNGAASVNIAAYNATIPSNAATASGNWEGGPGYNSKGRLLATQANYYYTYNIVKGTSYASQLIGILETSYNPVSISSVAQAAGPIGSRTITITTSGTPAAGENVFVRYSTTGYVSSTLVQASGSGTTWTATIPFQASAVSFYAYTSNRSLASITTDVTTYGQGVHDIAMLNLNNNGGVNYSWTPLSGPVAVFSTGGTGAAGVSYPTLTVAGGAFAALNGGTAHTGTVTVYITASIPTETGATALNASAAWTSMSINPVGAITVSGSPTAPLIDLNGADNVTIDGLNTGGNSLTISNTATGAASTIRFINDATNNTIQNCTLQGSSSTASNGTVFFSTGTTTGNDGNNINNCTITAAGANQPINGIFSLGTNSAVDNSGITINANNISDYFNATLVSVGINLGSTGNSAWTITNNKLFQTATRIFTASNTHNGINIGTGSGYTITGNTIGFANSSGTGTTNIVGNTVALTGTFPSSYTTTGTANATRYIALNCSFSPGGAASSIQGNTIAGFALYTSSGATTTNGIFCGININSGNANIGTVSGNTIGATTGTGSIYAATTTTGGIGVGIYATTTNAIAIRNNTIGAMDIMGTTASISGGFNGINIAGTPTSYDVSGNTIGNSTNPNIRMGNLTTGANLSNVGTTFGIATGTAQYNGILNTVALPVAGTIGTAALPNTIRNASLNSSSTTTSFRGITSSGSPIISNNAINNLTTQSTNNALASTALAGMGIFLNGNNAGTIVRNNTINSLSLANATTNGTNIAAIASFGASTDIYGNKIYDINNASTSSSTTAPGTASALFFRQPTGTFNFYNNMVSLGNGQTTNTAFNGIWEQQSGATVYTLNAYFNTINIEGTVAAGAQPSFCFNRGSYTTSVVTQTVSILNNIFTNTRSGGTGKHYTLGNCYGAAAADATGWPSNASDYNVLNAAAATVGYWTTDQTFAGWKAASASDAHSYSGITVTYASSPTGNLHLNMGASATVLESHGVTGTGITTDFDGQARPGGGVVNGGGFAPDLGADEFDGTYIDDIAPAISYTLLANTTSTANRTTTSFATITDATGVNTTIGTRPRIYYKLSTDLNTFNDNTSGTAGWKYAEAGGTSSPYDFTIDYSKLSGSPVITAGNIIQYFVVAQDLAGTPNVGINSGTFTATPTSVALTSAAFPINGTINQYYISSGISGILTVPGTYPTLTGAGGLFAAINAGVITGNVTVNITANLTEDGSNALNQWSEEPAASNFTLSINPDAAVVRTITGNVPAGMIRFNGADRVTVDGRFGGSGKFLSFINTDGTFLGTCFSFLNGATNNTLKYCAIQAVTISVGGVLFGTTTSVGNSNNTIDNCNIRAFDGTFFGNVCISSTGTVGNENINNTISNNEMFDFGSRALDIAATGTTAWTISNNSLYHTGGGLSYGTGAGSLTGLRIQGGGNYTITGNYIGGSAAGATGANPLFSSTAALVTYTGISAALTTGTSNIKGNVIRGTSINCVPTTAVGGVYVGISVSGLGAANIGGALPGEGNTIGSNTANSSIVFTTTTALTTSTTQLNGINSSGIGNLIRGNTIGGYDINNLGAGPAATSFFGIVSTGITAAPPMLITENVVGSNGAGASSNSIRFLSTSLATAHSFTCITAQGNAVATNITNNFIRNISNQSTTSSGGFTGIFVASPISFPVVVTGNTIDNISSVSNTNGASAYTAIASSVINSTVTISNNTISNITQNSTNASAAVRGITHSGSSVATISSNTISNLSTSGAIVAAPTGGVTGAEGILLTSTANLATISQNTISGISDNNTGALATSASGIGVTGATSASITRNKIFDISNTSTGTTATSPPTASGIICGLPTSDINIYNNFVALGNAQTTNTQFNGLWVITSGSYNVNANYNSISVLGTAASGALPSFGLLRGDNSGTAVTSNMNLRDNIFSNARTGGTGKHYAIANQATVVSTTGWPSTASNYNDLIGGTAATVGLWGATDQTFAAWQASSAGDNNSINISPVFTSASDLHLTAVNTALKVGTPIAGITTDYDAQVRDASLPTIGADEFSALYTWTGASSTVWNLAANWSPAVVPNPIDNAAIPNVANKPALTAAATINDINIAASAFVDINGQTFTINGAVSGTGTLRGSSASNLTIGGTAGTLNFDQTSSATSSLKNLTLNAGTASLASSADALNLYGVLSVTGSSSLDLNNQVVTLKSTGTAAAATARVDKILAGNTISNATNVVVERYIATPQRAWHLLSAQAVTGSQNIFDSWQESGAVVANKGTWLTSGSTLLPGFDGTSQNGASILVHDQTVPSWTTIPVANTNSTALSARQGYMLFVRGDRNCTPANNTVTPTVLKAKGTLTQGNVNVSVATGTGNTMVGNPYASPVDMETIMAPGGTNLANLDQNFMIWDPALTGNYGVGGFRAVVRNGVNSYDQTPVVLGGTTTNDPTIQFLHSGQAFFVHATGSVATLPFTESSKVAAGTTVINPIVNGPAADQQLIANLMNINNGTAALADGIRVRFNDTYNANTTDDIIKMGNFSENLSSYREGKKLIVERRPVITTNDTIFLRMSNTAIKDYRFQVGTIDFVQQGLTAFLEDTYSNTKTPLNLDGSVNNVNFSITSDPATANQDRFRIVFNTSAAPLPVSFTSIKATQQGANVAVEWKVSSEQGMKNYEVEKSTDGINFAKMATQAATANNSSDITYHWLDVNPAVGNNYYRIRSIANSGNMKYSAIARVTIGKITPGITVYPNPVTDKQLGLQFAGMDKGVYQLRLISTTGQVVLKTQVSYSGGSSSQSVQLGNIASGNYHLEITAPDNTKTVKALNVAN